MDEKVAIEQTLKYAEGLRELYAEERRQRRRAEEALSRLEDSYATTVRALAAALELRDDASGEHADRVTGVALELARRAAPALVRDPTLEYGFLLHDVGKIGIPDRILLKPGPLDEAELAVMRTHPVLGDELVATIPTLGPLVREVVAFHHEHYDGGGYPHGLAGEEIPLAARIFAIADAWDAMTNDRPYRRALAGAGSQFDPALVGAFRELELDRAT